jgi:hypothetical protein
MALINPQLHKYSAQSNNISIGTVVAKEMVEIKDFPAAENLFQNCGMAEVEYEKGIEKSTSKKYKGKFFTAVI